MFEDALRFPWHGERNAETLLVGGLLTLLGVLLLPLFFVYGYLVRVVRRTAAGDIEAPPRFTEWGDLLVDGLVVFVIAVFYAIVPAIVVAVGVLGYSSRSPSSVALGPTAVDCWSSPGRCWRC